MHFQKFILFMLFLSPIAAFSESAGRLYSKEGTVQVRVGGNGDWTDAPVNAQFEPNDVVRTGAGSRAALLMSDGVMVRLNQNSRFVFNAPSAVTVESGDAHFLSRKPSDLPTIRTPLVTASIRGTEFTVFSSPERSVIGVLQGSVRLENSQGAVDLLGGEEGSVRPGEGPQKGLLVSPRDAVRWAIHYPSYLGAEDLPSAATLAPIFGAFNQGAIEEARRLLHSNRTISEGDRLLVGATLDLARGQVDDAQARHRALEKLIATSNAEAQAHRISVLRSQQAVIAIAQNRTIDAEKLLAEVPGENTPIIALARSYLSQATFDLDAARSVISSAIERYPQHGFLRARYAEILLSFGESESALQEATLARELGEQSGTAEYVRGFALLALDRTDDAVAVFSAIVGEGSSLGLPYLGLGLGYIRQGDLVQGRELLQKAVHLEPNVALYRSYLGKALYEQGEEQLAYQELSFSMQLDEKDPTPYLYRAFERLSKHDPIAALHDLEQSVELNDNRAVYRSRLLLDQDRGVRSASLAEVYQQLGFTELATVEALKSISRDYSNYSAHLLLGQSYESRQDLVQASISETLIARLLSPVSFNLVRPSQGGQIGANEYTTLFDRDQNRIELTAFGDSYPHELGGGVLFSGTKNGWGYALQHETRYLDGYRDNDNLEQHLEYGSLQYQASSNLTMLVDVKTEFYEAGDIESGYFAKQSDPDSTLDLDDYTFRYGFNYQVAPGGYVLGQVVHTDADVRVYDDDSPRIGLVTLLGSGEEVTIYGSASQDVRYQPRGTRFDLQYISDGDRFSHIVGVGGLDASILTRESGETIFPDELLELSLSSRSDNTESSLRGYYYGTWHVAPWVDLQAGASYARLHLAGAPLSVPTLEETETIDELSPKFGIVINPREGTTVRGAFYESIGSSGIRELETIEPTILGGFNQSVFDFYPGTKARALALGVDQRIEQGAYVGVQGVKRHVIEHFPQSFDTLIFDEESGEIVEQGAIAGINPDNHYDRAMVRAYAYKTIGKRVTCALDFAHFTDDDTLADTEVRTNRVALGVNYFDPSGAFAYVSGTWRRQELDGFGGDPEEIHDGTERFWIVDAGVGYRFAKRQGQIVLAATNIFDEDYRYQQNDAEADFYPGASIGLRFTYNFQP